MQYVLRDYQESAAHAGADFLMNNRKKNWNGLIVASTGSGKSLIIAAIVSLLDAPCIVFQPSKEILEQNLAKFKSYGFRPAIYSASKNRKQVGEVTLATIGSVKAPTYDDYLRLIVAFMLRLSVPPKTYAAELFEGVPYVIIDEAHAVNPQKGLYKEFLDFLSSLDRIKVLGLTATPYRMASNSQGTSLRFLTRTLPRVFNEVIFWTQNRDLFDHDPPYLAKLRYYPIKDSGFDHTQVKLNSDASDYDQDSLQLHLFEGQFKDKLAEIVERLLKAGRRNVLVFTQFVWQGELLAEQLPGVCLVTSETKKVERETILSGFKSGSIKVVVNCNILGLGFDFPLLECVVLAAPTLSLARYYQRIGRAIRIHPDKAEAWIVDLVDSYGRFGRAEDLMLYCTGSSLWYIAGRPGGPKNKEVTLTNVILNGGTGGVRCKDCNSSDVFWMRHIVTGNSALLSRPTPGMKPNIALKKTVEGKTVYAIVGADDPEAEFLMHRIACRKSKSASSAA